MKLNILERLLLVNVLPEKGNAVTLRIVSQLRERLSFSESDVDLYGITEEKNEDGVVTGFQWDPEKSEEESDIKIGATAQRTIVDTLEELDKNEELEMQHLSLLDKFGIGED